MTFSVLRKQMGSCAESNKNQSYLLDFTQFHVETDFYNRYEYFFWESGASGLFHAASFFKSKI